MVLVRREGEVKSRCGPTIRRATSRHRKYLCRSKAPYESAISQRSGDYEEVLWSTADSEWLDRYLKDMYSSYEYVMKQIPTESL